MIQEAGKYSFLRVDKKKPAALVTNFDEPAGSDLELDLNTGIDNEKPNEPKLDMKNLEAFFKNAATASRPPPSKRTPKPASKTKSKTNSWTARKQRSLKLFKVLRRGSFSSEKNEQRSSERKQTEHKEESSDEKAKEKAVGFSRSTAVDSVVFNVANIQREKQDITTKLSSSKNQ
ncbi:hypothetical protein COOONC_10496 [Cooperia oncophora]